MGRTAKKRKSEAGVEDKLSKQVATKSVRKSSDMLSSSNECKQNKRKLKSNGKVTKKHKKNESQECITMNEDDDILETEVDGQNTLFTSEASETEQDSDSNFEEGEIPFDDEALQVLQSSQESVNNNATVISRSQTLKDNRKESEVEILDRSVEMAERNNREEEAFFSRFKSYLEKEGLFKKGEQEEPVRESKKPSSGKNICNEFGKGKSSLKFKGCSTDIGSENSEVTVYQAAVNQVEKGIEEICSLTLEKRFSSSSDEDFINTSDETNDDPEIQFADKHRKEMSVKRTSDGAIAHCSRDDFIRHYEENAADQRAEKILRDAEQSKAQIFDVPGNIFNHSLDASRLQAVIIDDSYLTMGANIDQGLKQKIQASEYIDLGRLLPQDVVQSSEDHRMEMVNKGGLTYWVPMSDRENSAVSSYIKWEQAFRVFTNIYAQTHPTRVTELLQYNHVIETVAAMFQWENVYRYDKEFRLHMSQFPECNWGIILQQAWTLGMKNVNHHHQAGNGAQGSNTSKRDNQQNSGGRKKICFKFNQGICQFGFNCKFEHKCGICGKYGHGAYSCCKLQSNGNHQNNNGNQTQERSDKTRKENGNGNYSSYRK